MIHLIRTGAQSWWWVQADQYILSFGQLHHYMEQARYLYRRWLPPGRAWIYVLRRNEDRAAPVALSDGDYVNLDPCGAPVL